MIVGRKPHESIIWRLGRPLPDRTTIVLDREQDFPGDGCMTARSWDEGMDLLADQDEVFIIGGDEIHRLALAHAQRLYFTGVHARVEGDGFLPEFGRSEWRVVYSEFPPMRREERIRFSVRSSREGKVSGTARYCARQFHLTSVAGPIEVRTLPKRLL